MPGEIKIGLDGNKYMVFQDGLECENNSPDGAVISCFGQYENAYLLDENDQPVLLHNE